MYLGIPEQWDSVSFADSSNFTFSTRSTVWGPGALAGKFLKAFGDASLDVIMNGIIRKRLRGIKKIFDNNPGIHHSPNWIEESEDIHRDLRELHRRRYSRGIREEAAALLMQMEVRRALATITLMELGIFAAPGSDFRADEIYEKLVDILHRCRAEYFEKVPKEVQKEVMGVLERIAFRNFYRHRVN